MPKFPMWLWALIAIIILSQTGALQGFHLPNLGSSSSGGYSSNHSHGHHSHNSDSD